MVLVVQCRRDNSVIKDLEGKYPLKNYFHRGMEEIFPNVGLVQKIPLKIFSVPSSSTSTTISTTE